MNSTLLSAVAVVGAASSAVVAGSAAAVAYRVWNRSADATSATLLDEKLRAYREILDKVVAFNRLAVSLGEEQFEFEAGNVALEQESKLDDAYRDLNQVFESNFHVVSPSVREAGSEFLDYPATYHADGAHLGELLTLGGAVFAAMREDLGLETLFPSD